MLATRQCLCLVSDALDTVFIFLFWFFFFILGDSLETAALKQSCGKAAGEQTFPLFGAKAAAVEMWARAPEHPSESIQGRSHYS